MFENLLYICLGFVLLFVGGDYLVRAAVSLAHRLGMSSFVVGITIVGFGTSVPELITSLNAVLSGAEGIAAGNIIGSNISNCLLVLGVAAVISPLRTNRSNMSVDGTMLIIATIWLIGAAIWGEVSRPIAGFGLAMMIALTLYTVTQDRKHEAESLKGMSLEDTEMASHSDVQKWSIWFGLSVFILALVAVLSGADYLVDGAVGLAIGFGVPDELIGVTIVAVGTSLPELAAAFSAALRKEQDLAFGNVIGSNLFNILGILTVTSLVEPVEININAFQSSLIVLVLSTIAVLVFSFTGRKITRLEGSIFLAGFTVFLILQVALMRQSL